MPPALLAAANGGDGPDGLTGFVLDVVDRLGEVGIGLLLVIETVFPPIPSELVLPLGGYLAERGRLGLAGVLVAATIGSVLGALVLYVAGDRAGRHRTTRWLAKLPLLDEDDVQRSFDWFERHGEWAVLIGRLVPGVRSLVSLPAGSAHMGLVRFTLLTALGSAVWNTLLIGAGYALGTQYELVEKYSNVLDVAMIAAVVAGIAWLVRRRVRKRHPTRS